MGCRLTNSAPVVTCYVSNCSRAPEMNNICCPKCDFGLAAKPGTQVCEACGEVYPVVMGVPILVPGTSVTTGEVPSASFAQSIVNSGPPRDCQPADANEQIREAFSKSFKFTNPIIQSESSQFLSRLRSSGVEVEDMVPQNLSGVVFPTARDRRGAQVAGRIVTFPETLSAGSVCSFNVQISNIGPETLSSLGDCPFHISYTLFDCKGTKIEGHRTKLLIDLPPGRAITQPVRFECPSSPGVYRFCLQPLIEHVEWLDELDEIKFDVLAHQPDNAVVGEFTNVRRDYSEDHLAAVSFLKDRIKSTDTIIEIGGNYRPYSVLTGNFVINVDVDPFGLIASKILYSHVEEVLHVVADGTCLPIQDQQAEVVAMFATFHHFPDPVALLKHLHSKMSETGKLFLLCEPCGHHFAEEPDEAYIKELKSGAYEQSFLPWEYEQLLAAGGFRIAEAVFDIGSSKILAEPIRGIPPKKDKSLTDHWSVRRFFSRWT